MMLSLRFLLGFTILTSAIYGYAHTPSVSATPIEHMSPYSFDETLNKIEATLTQANMTLFARIDHHSAAQRVGLSMPKTQVIIYGNPRGGTPLMVATPPLALDLPLRVLIREDQQQQTWVSWHSAQSLSAPYGLAPQQVQVLQGGETLIQQALQKE